MTFDNQEGSVNKFDRATLEELKAAADLLTSLDAEGLLVVSGKRDFIVGADITEFGELFKGTEEQLIEWMGAANQIFSQIEDLPYPSISAISAMRLAAALKWLCRPTTGSVRLAQWVCLK